MKNKKVLVGLIIVTAIVIPFVIQLLFKMHPSNEILVAEWSAGEILTYFGTIALGSVTVYFAYQANNINDRVTKLQELDKYSFVRLEEITLGESSDGLCLQFFFVNDNESIPINDIDVEMSDRLIKKGQYNSANRYSDYSSINGDFFEKSEGWEFCIYFKNKAEIESELSVFCFKARITNVYGLVIDQYFNVWSNNDVQILGYSTEIGY